MNQWVLCRDSATSLLVLIGTHECDTWVCGSKKGIWKQFETWDAQFQQVLVHDDCRKMWKVLCDQLCELHRGRRFGDGLDCLVTCHASCGSDPRRAHGHLSHGTLAFDLAHGHIGKPRCEEIWYLKFYIKATWVLRRFLDTVKRQTMHETKVSLAASFSKDQIQIFKCRSHLELDQRVRCKSFCIWIVLIATSTLPETNVSKIGGWETTFLLRRPIFTGYVSSREGIHVELYNIYIYFCIFQDLYGLQTWVN